MARGGRGADGAGGEGARVADTYSTLWAFPGAWYCPGLGLWGAGDPILLLRFWEETSEVDIALRLKTTV